MKKITKITQKQIAAAGVQALANRPNAVAQYGLSGLSPQQLKLHFDKLATLIAEKVNEIGDVISSDDAAQYIRIALDDYGVGSLDELVEAMLTGKFAEKILYVIPSVDSLKAITLQQAIYGIAKAISDNKDYIKKVEDYVNDIIAPRLYPPSICLSENLDGYLKISDDEKNGFLTTGYKCYVDGEFSINSGDLPFLSSIVPAGKSGAITVTSDGEGFGIKFRESLPSNSIFFSNIVNFSIDGVTYVAGKNMNWRDWVESDLSPDGFTVTDGDNFYDGYVMYNGKYVVDGETYKRIKKFDIIRDTNYSAAAIKSFSLAYFHFTSPNGNNIFDFLDGMTFAQWKESEYNSFLSETQQRTYRFEAMSNSYTIIDVAVAPDTPVEGICFADGIPVTDVDVIEATEYYFLDCDSYDPANQIKDITLDAGQTSKTVAFETAKKAFTLNGINGLTDNVESIVYNDDGTVTINYATDTDVTVNIYFTGV